MNLSGNFYPQSSRLISKKATPFIGVIGGTGICKLPGLRVQQTLNIETPYGATSEPIVVGELSGCCVAFIPRHGVDHTIPPHKVPFKANLFALKAIGVQHVIGTCVVGSLKKHIKPGMFVLPNQFINLTWGRDDTYASDRNFIHLPMANPYCEHLRKMLAKEILAMNFTLCSEGTVVVIQGPRFSTIAESKMFALWGGDIVNMTQYPECYFARELGICYVAVASVTDYDVGVLSNISMKTEHMTEVLKVFQQNTANTVTLIERLVNIPKESMFCGCSQNHLDEYYKLSNS